MGGFSGLGGQLVRPSVGRAKWDEMKERSPTLEVGKLGFKI